MARQFKKDRFRKERVRDKDRWSRDGERLGPPVHGFVRAGQPLRFHREAIVEAHGLSTGKFRRQRIKARGLLVLAEDSEVLFFPVLTRSEKAVRYSFRPHRT